MSVSDILKKAQEIAQNKDANVQGVLAGTVQPTATGNTAQSIWQTAAVKAAERDAATRNATTTPASTAKVGANLAGSLAADGSGTGTNNSILGILSPKYTKLAASGKEEASAAASKEAAAKNALAVALPQMPLKMQSAMKQETEYDPVTGFDMPTQDAARVDARRLGAGTEYAVRTGLDEAASGISSTLDLLIGKNITLLGNLIGQDWSQNPISAINERLQAEKTANQQILSEQMQRAGVSKTGETVANLGTMVTAAVPQAVIALLSAGTSLAGQGTTAALQAASSVGMATAGTKLVELGRTMSTALTAMAKSPNYWTAFLQVAGNNYDDEKAKGASDFRAVAFAVVNGLLNAMVEVGGGGIQELPTQLKSGSSSAVMAWVESMFDEGKEEVVQGVIERLLQNVIVGENNALFSTTDANAVINPVTAAKEFGGGALVGGILGGGQSLITGGGTNVPGGTVQNAETTRTAQTAQTQEQTAPVTQQSTQAAQTAQEQSDVEAQRDAQAATEAHEEIDSGALKKAEATVTEIVTKPVTNSKAKQIIDDPALSAAFERLSGETLTGTISEQRSIIKDYAAALEAQREIEAGRAEPDTIRDTYTPRPQSGLHIDDRGYADVSSRKVNAFQFDNPELHQYFVDAAGGLLMQLNNTTKGERFAADLYFTEPDRPGGDSFLWKGTKRDTSPEIEQLLDNAHLSYAQIRKAIDDLIADHGQENYAAAKKVELILDEMLTDGFEVEGEYIPADEEYIRKKEAIKNGENPNGYNMSEEEWNSLFSNEYNAPEENKGNDDGIGAKTAKFGYDEAETQTRSSDGLYSEMERTQDGIKAEDRTHKVNHDAEVDEAAAQRYEFDYEGEKADLFSTKQDWDDADTVLAHKILANEVEKARKSGSAEAWKEVARLQKVWDAQGTTAGQAFRQRGRFANTPDAMVAEAANVIYGEDADTKLRRLSPQRKAGIMETVKDMADRYNAIEAGDTASLVSLIKRLNEIRKTTGLFSNKTSKQMEWALDWYAKNGAGGETLLRDVAAAQIRNIAGDYARLSPVEAAKNYRIAGMLSKVSTIMRNLISNNVIDPLDSLSNNLAVPLDSLLSKYTKTRSVAVDKSWASKAKRAGSLDGAVRSFIQVGLDADVTDSASKYEQRSGRVFKMTGNPIERLLSTWSKMEGYALQTTDEFQKGGIKAETQRGLNELSKSGAVGADYAGTRSTEIAKQRTFQNDGALSNMMLKGRDALNSLKITDKQGGTMGAGDVQLPFAKVPANVTAMLGNYSPLGLAKGMLDVGRVIAQAKSGTLTPELQAKAVTGIGRGMTGSTALAGFVALALKGILNVGGSDDKDEDALQKSSGVTGTQMNLSALERWIAGKSTEWQDGDKLVSIGFLEPLNGLMAAAAAIADSYAEDHEVSLGDIANASVEAVFQSVIDLPAMSSISNLINSYKYSKADTTSGKIGDALGGYAAGQASSFLVPNFVGGMASGFDNTVRDAYSGETGFQQAVDGIKLKIPGLRQTLPAKLDNFGNERTNTGNSALNFLNANILPGQITKYKTNAVNDELYRLGGTEYVRYVFPDRAAPKAITAVSGQDKMLLTQDERRSYQQTYGEYAENALSALFASAEYRGMSDAEKADAISEVYSDASVEAKRFVAERAGGMYLPESGDVARYEEYKSAGLSPSRAYDLYKTLDGLTFPDGATNAEKQQTAVQTIYSGGYTEKQTAALVGLLYTNSAKTSLLSDLNVSDRLISLYLTSGNTDMINMTVPSTVSENSVSYELTDAEKATFRQLYTDYFNQRATYISTEQQLNKLRDEAWAEAKAAVIAARG